MGLEETARMYESVCRFNSKRIRKKEMFFRWCSSLSNDGIICYQLGLKTGMDFRGQVGKWVSIITCIFWSEIVSGFGYIHVYPHQEFPGIPPPPGSRGYCCFRSILC